LEVKGTSSNTHTTTTNEAGVGRLCMCNHPLTSDTTRNLNATAPAPLTALTTSTTCCRGWTPCKPVDRLPAAAAETRNTGAASVLHTLEHSYTQRNRLIVNAAALEQHTICLLGSTSKAHGTTEYTQHPNTNTSTLQEHPAPYAALTPQEHPALGPTSGPNPPPPPPAAAAHHAALRRPSAAAAPCPAWPAPTA